MADIIKVGELMERSTQQFRLAGAALMNFERACSNYRFDAADKFQLEASAHHDAGMDAFKAACREMSLVDSKHGGY